MTTWPELYAVVAVDDDVGPKLHGSDCRGRRLAGTSCEVRALEGVSLYDKKVDCLLV